MPFKNTKGCGVGRAAKTSQWQYAGRSKKTMSLEIVDIRQRGSWLPRTLRKAFRVAGCGACQKLIVGTAPGSSGRLKALEFVDFRNPWSLCCAPYQKTLSVAGWLARRQIVLGSILESWNMSFETVDVPHLW